MHAGYAAERLSNLSILIAYGTIEGQSGKIARYCQRLAEEGDERVVLIDTSVPTSRLTFDGVNRIILIGSVHERRHPKFFELFVSTHRKEIGRRRTLLLSVSLSAAFPEGREEAQDYVDEMKMRTRLKPSEEILVAGAVKGGRYGYYEKQVIRHVVLRGREYDPDAREHEFTDWDALARGVDAFLARPTSVQS